MGNPADYEIVTFQRKPGLWRASVTRKDAWNRIRGHVLLSFITTKDSESEEGAKKAAGDQIKDLSS